ncbi:hypothetical protein [Spirosoma validum]|uniref:Uncharacterized protein n=1 Tax=Spirosoma validum TaxID=2771355 RepID=A0A927B066_9BACT|nr:hypothetical protein [Spirosoma validum]MBD2753111.1 hypothetical protein [Spirosoma validum]
MVKTLSILKETLGWEFASVPNRNSIENWVKKSGYFIYKEPPGSIGENEGDYAMIVDESMMIGSEKMLLTLGIKAEKTEPLATTHQDVCVLNISVQPSWNSQKIAQDLAKSIQKLGVSPRYIISDNGSSLSKAIRDSGCVHIRDVGHTLGMLLERVYKNDPEFIAYMKEVSQVRFREIMKPIAYLLPPKQRTLARFLNLSPICAWSVRMLQHFHTLTSHEQQIFSFIPRYGSFIEELTEVIDCINQLQRELKQKGICRKTAQTCRSIIGRHLNCNNERTRQLIHAIDRYLSEESGKSRAEGPSWHASSDVIESLIGMYKAKKSPNPLYGVTGFVQVMPLYTYLGSATAAPFNFKKSLENVFLKDIQQWERNNLTENLVIKRTKKLQSA